MWFLNIIKGILYSIFVEVWVVGLIVVTLLVYLGIAFFEALKNDGYILFGILVLLIFAGALVYIDYWYFANHHYILGSVSILIFLAVLYMAYIEPHIHK